MPVQYNPYSIMMYYIAQDDMYYLALMFTTSVVYYAIFACYPEQNMVEVLNIGISHVTVDNSFVIYCLRSITHSKIRSVLFPNNPRQAKKGQKK